MKKRIIAMGLAVVLTLSMSLTAFAASSTTSKNSGDQGTTVEQAQPGGAVKPDTVQVAVASEDGTVQAVSLPTVVTAKQEEVKQVVAAVAAAVTSPTAEGKAQAATAISNILSRPASETFTATVQALAEMKGGNLAVNNMGTVKTAATAQDALGNTIASAGVIKNVTSGALVMLMSVNADGTIEYVEGVVDPLTGSVIGAFKGIPTVITVMVLA